MSVSILATKLYIPPARENAVARPRLIEKLSAGAGRLGSFALLCGPAGSGKTTLLSELAAQLPQPVAWVSLDEGDNDPIRFWTYLVTACRSVLDGVGDAALALFRSPQPLSDEAVPTILINDLVAQDREIVLVMDDYHEIQNPSVHAGLLFLLDHLPPNLHPIVSTRTDPPWPLSRFRARNRLVEIRARELRFSIEEAAEFLHRTMDLELSGEEIAALEARTEGWAAGLQLAGLSMQGRSDLAEFVEAFTGSHLYVAEYLVEEVLRRQPEDVQTFLLQTSILKRMNAGLCEAVTDRGDGQAVLQSLHHANTFVLPLDDEGRWFRYHQLFADLLQARLRQAFPAEALAELHRRAASWYERNGLVVEAFNHARAAADFDSMGRLIEQNAYSVINRGELTTLLRWFDALPAGQIRLHPQIVIAKAWTLTLAGAFAQVEPLLQQVEAQIEAGTGRPTERELLGTAAAIRAFFSMMAGDYPRALEMAERAESFLPESSVHARWLLPYTLGAARRGQGQYEQAVEAFARQARMGEEYDNLIVWATGVTEVAIAYRHQGRLREAAATCLQALQKIAERGAAKFGSLAKLEVPLIEVLREQNELEEAHRRIEDVIERMRAWPMPTDRIFACLAQISVQEARGDLTGAFETLRAAKDLKAAQPVLANLARSVDLAEVRLHLKSGGVAAAARLMEALEPGASRVVFLRDQELLLLARLRLAQGRPDEAHAILTPLAGEAEAGGRKAAWIEALALQACVLHARGDREAALAALNKALALAEPEGFVRLFVDEGESMQQLLAAVARRPASDQTALPADGYIGRLLGAFPEVSTQAASQDPAAGLVEPLTPRELEVLQLIAAGDSNRTIAEKLVITVSAVKKHTGNIYGKLNVNSRTQAVARARQYGLLPADA